MFRRIFTRNHFRSFGNGMLKLVMDCLLTYIFSCFALISVCGAIPHIAEHYSAQLLSEYALFFTLVWNVLLSSGVISVLTIGVLFASMTGGLLFYLLDDGVRSFMDAYFRWISTLFLPVNAGNDLYEYITVIAITILLVLLMTLFASRHSNAGLVFILILPAVIYYDFSAADTGSLYIPTLLFGFSLFYMRYRHSTYLDYRLAERDEVRYTKIPQLVMLPALFLAILLSFSVTHLPEGLFNGQGEDLHLGNKLKDFLSRVEDNFFESRKDINYDIDRIGVDDKEGRFLNSSRVNTLTAETYFPDVNYLYLRSYSYRTYKNQWDPALLSGVEPYDHRAYFGAGEKELSYARRLLLNRSINSYSNRDKSQEYYLYRLLKKASVSLTYQDISTQTVFEVPLATNYSLFSSSKMTIRDDINGSGLFREDGTLSSSLSYTADQYVLDKNEYTILLYRYFGEGFYDSLTPKEIESVYGEDLAICKDNAERIRRQYGDLYGISPTILSLSKSLTQDAPTQADKALAIVDYLNKTCRYDASVYLPQDDSDFVETFLFETHIGSSVHFASAATLMMRAAGIPARYAEGYLTTTGGSLGAVEIRQRDEHAWAEIYLEGFGWLPMESTPGKGMLATELLSPSYDHPEAESSFWHELTLETIGNAILTGIIEVLVLIRYLLVGFFWLMVALIAFCFLRRAILFFVPSGYRGYRWTLLYLIKVLSFAGFHREKGEGLLTYALRLDETLPEGLQLAPHVRLAYAASYGGEPLSPSAERELKLMLFKTVLILKSLGASFRGHILGIII
ncbi:MAG: transglutaminase domain-containing protein [Clostridia bacterium]|nr:transglutaminase domain-containing protein [Clostridia bacterium]